MNRERGSDRLTTAARETTREERVAASRLVLRKARDRDDLHLLLEVLGLNDKPAKDTT